ncbi:MAG: NAD(P)/FAD-dependent oxidoreductase [Pikeienuella sp.]
MTSNIAKPLIIIGAGPVGLYAAFQAGLCGMRPIIIDSQPHPGGQCAALYPEQMIYDAPAWGEISGGALTQQLLDQAAPFDPLILYGRHVRSIWGSLNDGFNVETDTGETITGAAVVYAGGAGALTPRRLTATGVDDISTSDLSYAATDVNAAFGRRVAVVGDGAAAIDLALDAADRAKNVVLIHSRSLRADDRLLDNLNRAVKSEHLQLINGEIASLYAPGGRLRRISVDVNGAVLDHNADLLLVQAGLEIAEGKITGLGPITTPDTGETDLRGVFVIGDAVCSNSRPPVIAAGFSEALRAIRAAHARVEPNAPRTLPYTASSPALQRRLQVA